MGLPPMANLFIFAARQARNRADLATWVERYKPRIAASLPPPIAERVIEEARQHWRLLKGPQ